MISDLIFTIVKNLPQHTLLCERNFIILSGDPHQGLQYILMDPFLLDQCGKIDQCRLPLSKQGKATDDQIIVLPQQITHLSENPFQHGVEGRLLRNRSFPVSLRRLVAGTFEQPLPPRHHPTPCPRYHFKEKGGIYEQGQRLATDSKINNPGGTGVCVPYMKRYQSSPLPLSRIISDRK